MAYGDFTLDDLEQKFGVKNLQKRLFTRFEPVEPGDILKKELEDVGRLPIRSEKAKSEWIVVPVLRELRNRNDQFFTIFSGEKLNADEEKGLKGECDFILARDTGTFNINYPIIQIVEAKKNDIELGVPQCAAQLIGAKVFNSKKGVELSKVFGCVTTGNDWLFMVLEDDLIIIDLKIYFLNEIENVLGVFQSIIDYYKNLLK